MLEFEDLCSGIKKYPQTKNRTNYKITYNRSPLLSLRQLRHSTNQQFSRPKQQKIKPCHTEQLQSFNLCNSKDVFVFAKKMPRPESSLNSPLRKMWNSQNQSGSNEEVFLPNPNQKGRTYRILPKTSYAIKRNLDGKNSPRSMSTCRTRKASIRINPQPWELGVDPIDFDNIF